RSAAARGGVRAGAHQGGEMSATIIDGKAIAGELRTRVATEAARLSEKLGRLPGLAVVLVGNNPASEVYVRSKARPTVELGMASFEHKLPAATTEVELLKLVFRLSADPAIDGILVQLPLPPQINPVRMLNAISPEKDVDGFSPLNAGRLAGGLPSLIP